MPEPLPTPERQITDEELIRILSGDKELINPATREILNRWGAQEERKLDKSPLAWIGHEVCRARIYLTAGFGPESLEAFLHAYDQALAEGFSDFAAEIMTEIEEIEGRDWKKFAQYRNSKVEFAG